MIDATVLPTLPYAGGEGDSFGVSTVWIPRGGDHLRQAVESVANSESQLTIELWHKNRDEAGNGTLYSGPSIYFSDNTGIETAEWTGLKELIRFQLTLSPLGESSTRGGWILFRFLQPVWFESLKG